MKRILFQGDSITDAGRSRDTDISMGRGYATLVSARLGFEEPYKYEFFNRGISGNRSIDMLARIKSDAINLKPDIMSVLIGVNDVWHEFDFQNGIDADKYEMYYDIFISQIREALPDTKIMILEPFLLKGEATADNWNVFRGEVEKRAEASKRIAQKHGLPFIELMEKFDKVYPLAPMGYWLRDGVHPTAAGHELIAREWVSAFKKL